MVKNRTIIVNKEDINNPLHPNLWEDWLETLGIDINSTEVCLDLSFLDDNKKIKQKREHGEEVLCHRGCGGNMTWCETCGCWSHTCCVDYGTCLCS